MATLLVGVGKRAAAQPYGGSSETIDVDRAPLGQTLERVAALAGIGLVYDFGLVEGRRTSCSTESRKPSVLLRCLLNEHPIDFLKTSKGTYVLRKAVKKPPERGLVTGHVRGGRTGRQLQNVHVRLPEADGIVGTATDSTGRYRLSDLLPGPHRLLVTHVGYEDHNAEVVVPPNGTARHDVTLSAAPISGDSVVVDGNQGGTGRVRHGSERVSAAELVRTYGGGTADVLGAAESLLGVTTSAPYTDLHIQSGDTGGHILRLDGVPVRNPTSAGRLLGAFSPLALDGLTARKAGFGVLYGDAISGTVELGHDLSRRGAEYGSIRFDPRSLNVRLRGRTIAGKTPVTAMVAGRVSTWNVYQDGGLRDLIDRWSTLDPILASARMPREKSLTTEFNNRRTQPTAGFYDIHGAVRFDQDHGRRAYISAYRGASRVGANLTLRDASGEDASVQMDPDGDSSSGEFALPKHDAYSWSNTAAQFHYEGPVTPRAIGAFQMSLSHYRGETKSDIGSLREGPTGDDIPRTLLNIEQPVYGQRGLNQITEVALEGRLDVGLAERMGFTLIGRGSHVKSRFRIGNAFAPRIRHRTKLSRLVTAGEATVGLGAYTSLDAGLRVTGLPGQSRIFFEPRGALRFGRAMGRAGRLSARLKGGVYRQLTTQLEFSRDGATAVVPTTHVWLPVPYSLSPSRTYHLAGGVTWQPSDRWQVDAEGYRKWQPHVLAIDYPLVRTPSGKAWGILPPSRFLSSSRGYAIGGGVEVDYTGSHVAGEIGYSFSRARRTFPGRFGGRQAPVPWVEPHRVTLRANVPLGRGVSIVTEGESIWKRPWGFRRAYYAYLTPDDLESAWDRLALDRPGSHILSPLHRFDVGIRLNESWNGIDVKGHLGFVNVLNQKNVVDWGLTPHKTGDVTREARTLPGRRATMSIQLQY